MSRSSRAKKCLWTSLTAMPSAERTEFPPVFLTWTKIEGGSAAFIAKRRQSNSFYGPRAPLDLTIGNLFGLDNAGRNCDGGGAASGAVLCAPPPSAPRMGGNCRRTAFARRRAEPAVLSFRLACRCPLEFGRYGEPILEPPDGPWFHPM